MDGRGEGKANFASSRHSGRATADFDAGQTHFGMVKSGIVTVSIRTEPKPPVGVIESIGAGFETVATHIGLILIPVLLDLFLWAGPKITFQPLVDRFAAVSAAVSATQPADARQQLQAQNQSTVRLFSSLGQRINVFSLFSTTPVGVPSLMVEKLLNEFSDSDPSLVFTNSDWRIVSRLEEGQVVPMDWQAFTAIVALLFLLFNVVSLALPGFDAGRLGHPPAAPPLTLALTHELQFVLFAIALPLVGLLLTAWYYSQIGSVLREPAATARQLVRRSTINWARLTAFNLVFRFFIVCIGLPFILFLAVVQLLSVELSGVLASLGMTAGLWLMVYISFTMQAMVLQDRGVFGAVWDSIRLVHISLISVIGLAVLSFVLNWGMNFLFSLPETGSWLTLLGILGHAFVSTSLVTTTFVFYKDRYRWWTEMRQWLVTQARKPR